MDDQKEDKSNDRREFLKKGLGTAAGIGLVSIAGISLLKEKSGRNSENPFEYNIDNFKTVDPSLLRYKEEPSINIDHKVCYSITIDYNDRLYVSADKKILVFDSNKNLISTIDLNDSAYCLETDKIGNLYLGMADHIDIYDETGAKKGSWESLGTEAIITSLAVDEDYVYAADAGNLVVWKYDKNGTVVGEIGRKDEKKDIPGFIIPSPFFDVEIDPDGFLWAANTGRHSLENYSKDGGIRTSWGQASMTIEGFAGCCNPSHFIITEDGSFITAEKGLARIKVYNRLGNLEEVIAGPNDFMEGTVDLDLAVDSNNKIYTIDNKKKAVRIFSKKEEIKNES